MVTTQAEKRKNRKHLYLVQKDKVEKQFDAWGVWTIGK